MRLRGLGANAPEVVGPGAVALVLGVVILVLLSPGLRLGSSGGDPNVIRIYSSLPNRTSHIGIEHGIQMAIDEAGKQVSTAMGTYRIDFVPLTDDAPQVGTGGNVTGYKWNADVELANARRAAADPDAMVYIGTYNSGAAKISIPVLNRVHMAMISPGNTYPGLTKHEASAANEPWIYYPLGFRNYFRVVPADDLQGRAAAAFAQQIIKAKSVYVLDDTELYGVGIARIFAQEARRLGLTVLNAGADTESIDVRPTTTNYGALAGQIVGLNPDMVYFGGDVSNHPALVLKALRDARFPGAFMGADAIVSDDFIVQAGRAAVNGGPVYSTLVGLPLNQMKGAAAAWVSDYKSRYPNDSDDFASFGYEAGRVALKAIEKAGKKDREAIRAAMTTVSSVDLPANRQILDNWQFDGNGDTSLVTISMLQGGTQWNYLGGMSFANNTWTFQPK